MTTQNHTLACTRTRRENTADPSMILCNVVTAHATNSRMRYGDAATTHLH